MIVVDMQEGSTKDRTLPVEHATDGGQHRPSNSSVVPAVTDLPILPLPAPVPPTLDLAGAPAAVVSVQSDDSTTSTHSEQDASSEPARRAPLPTEDVGDCNDDVNQVPLSGEIRDAVSMGQESVDELAAGLNRALSTLAPLNTSQKFLVRLHPHAPFALDCKHVHIRVSHPCVFCTMPCPRNTRNYPRNEHVARGRMDCLGLRWYTLWLHIPTADIPMSINTTRNHIAMTRANIRVFN